MKKHNDTLQRLLNKCDKKAPMPETLVEWDKVKHVGKELGSEMEDREQTLIVKDS